MVMSCEEVERAIPWFLDDELEADLSLEIEAHVGSCPSCRSVLEQEGRLRLTLRRASRRMAASASLRRSVRESIEAERRQSNVFVRFAPAAAAAAVLAAFIWNGTTSSTMPLEEAAAEGHTRDLPMDVVAADVAPVQDYFNHKLPFAVQLPRFNQVRVKSLGGRITHLRDRDAAYVRYDTPQGRLSVFVYEDPDNEISEVAPLYLVGSRRMMVKQVRGYTVAKWRSAGLTYSVVTDLPQQEFSTVLRATLP